MSTADDIFAIFQRRGASAYFGECVSVTAHCLQTAWFARREAAPQPLVLAALLHDIGHLIEDCPDDIAEWTEDGRHEAVGAAWLARRFGPEVTEPVRLHVPAKRYLCAAEPGYLAALSGASVHTLKLQGGPMSAAEVAAFEREPYFREAILVRRCDDRGKVADLETTALPEYRPLIEALQR
ncbi:MAG TPA: HD domain-containing protein [Steroidobacteraceae bacterium]|nr:HD domain-containing protein [Steroidobacteraceae bacterium]